MLSHYRFLCFILHVIPDLLGISKGLRLTPLNLDHVKWHMNGMGRNVNRQLPQMRNIRPECGSTFRVATEQRT